MITKKMILKAIFWFQFDFENVIKTFFMAADHRFSIVDENLPLKVNDGDIPIFDMSGFTYRHITKLSLSTLRIYMKFTQEAFPVRLKQIHLINVSPVLNKVLMVLKPFMKSSVSELLNFHLPNTTTLYDHIPKEILPLEYGGNAGSMQEIKKSFVKRLESHRLVKNTNSHTNSKYHNVLFQGLPYKWCSLETTRF